MLIETIRVQVEPDEGDDLLEALSVRGIASRLVRDDEDGVEVEVSPPQERWELWNIEVVSALEAWLESRQRESVVARTDRHEYVVRAPRQPSERGARMVPAVELPGVDDTARMPVLAPVPESALPMAGALTSPHVHTRRPRGFMIAAAGATAVLALAGLLLLAVLLVNLF